MDKDALSSNGVPPTEVVESNRDPTAAGGEGEKDVLSKGGEALAAGEQVEYLTTAKMSIISTHPRHRSSQTRTRSPLLLAKWSASAW